MCKGGPEDWPQPSGEPSSSVEAKGAMAAVAAVVDEDDVVVDDDVAALLSFKLAEVILPPEAAKAINVVLISFIWK